jgi:hypothetical protein
MQDFFAILIVASAVAFLARRAWQHFTRWRASACGGCSGCVSDSSQKQSLVSISISRGENP